jgi:hypothetical protein
MNQTTAQALKRTRAHATARKASQRDRCTLLLPSDLSLRLTVAAHLRGLDRSELATELLAEALRSIVISVRGQSPSSAKPDGDVSQESPETVAAA